MSEEVVSQLPWTLRVARRLPAGPARRISAWYGRWKGDPRDRRTIASGLRILGSEETSQRLHRAALGHEWSRCMAGEKLAQFSATEVKERIASSGHNYLADLRDRGAGVLAAVFQLHALDVLRRCTEGEDRLVDIVFFPGESVAPHEHLLDQGKILALSHEWYPETQTGIRTPLFDRLAGSSTEIAELAFAHGVPVVPVWVHERDETSWELWQERPLLPKGSAEGMTLRLVRCFAAWMEAHPADVDWLRHPWRPPVTRILWSRRREKIVLPSGVRPETLAPFRIAVRVPSGIREGSMAIPAVRALKRGRRDAAVTVFGPGASEALWKAVSEVDVYVHEEEWKDDGEHFDVGVMLEEDPAAWKRFQTIPADRFVGRDRAPAGKEFDDPVSGREMMGPPEHRTRLYLRTAHRMGAKVQKEPALMRPAPLVDPGIPRSGPLHLALAPFSEEGSSYRWPLERYGYVVREISERVGCVWHVFGDASNREETTELHRGIPDVVLKGHHGDEPLEAVWRRLASCHAILGNDGMYMHLAGAAGVPGVCLFGPSDPSVYLPWSSGIRAVRQAVECSPCSLSRCPLDHRCMTEIPVERVVGVMMEVLQEVLLGQRMTQAGG